MEAENKKIFQRIEETKFAHIRRREHKEFEPSFIQIIFTLGRALREWREKDKNFASTIDINERNLQSARLKIKVVEAEFQEAEQNLRSVEVGITNKRLDYAIKKSLVKKAEIELGEHFLSYAEWAGSDNEEKRELSAPWSDRKWQDARALVFLEAINLHKAFIARSSVRMMDNLWAAIDVLSGEVSTSAAKEAVAAAWTTLFFVVPVVSTTFASFDRLFAHLGRESLGWLFIDEAGQASPQSAAGAIWRAKRTVVVGDPLQLEPISSLPFTLQQALRRYYKIEETWLPGKTSTQQLADRVNRYGTEIKQGNKNIWIGAPLRVHRRCAPEIFDISNRIAYDGLIILAERQPKFTEDFVPSRWINVEAGNRKAVENWIPAEGDAVYRLLDELKGKGIAMSDVFLISPFRSVVDELQRFSRAYRGLCAGTVHTVQGKEALIVILILGSDPTKNGARKWAAEKPNLLNVAVSRAKERLYVIGSHDLWREQSYFEILAEQFPK